MIMETTRLSYSAYNYVVKKNVFHLSKTQQKTNSPTKRKTNTNKMLSKLNELIFGTNKNKTRC